MKNLLWTITIAASSVCAQTNPTVGNDQISLRDYVEKRLETQRQVTDASFLNQKEAVAAALAAAERAVAAALAAAEKAVTKAEIATEKRFESVNEFRAALNDSARLLMPRNESEAAFKIAIDRINALEHRMNNADAEAKGAISLWSILIAAAGLMFGVLSAMVSIFFAVRKLSPEPQRHVSQMNGTGQQVPANTGGLPMQSS